MNMNVVKLVFVSLIIFFQGVCFADNPIAKEGRKTFIITGASGELGGATARLLARDYDLILTGRDSDKLKKLQEELMAANAGHYEVCTLDYLSNESRENFKNYLNQSHTPISGILLVAPRPQFSGTSLIQDEAVWLKAFQSTFTGPVGALSMVLPYLSNPSKIVIIAGTSTAQLLPEYGPSCVTCRTWATYTKALSHQLGPQGISVNTLSPGVILTQHHKNRIQNAADKNGLSYDEQMENETKRIPLHRHGKPQEVAQTVKFLLTEQSDFINGANLIFDGGFTVSY